MVRAHKKNKITKWQSYIVSLPRLKIYDFLRYFLPPVLVFLFKKALMAFEPLYIGSNFFKLSRSSTLSSLSAFFFLWLNNLAFCVLFIVSYHSQTGGLKLSLSLFYLASAYSFFSVLMFMISRPSWRITLIYLLFNF